MKHLSAFKLTFLFVFLGGHVLAQQPNYEAKVDSLMKLMTLEEKIGQTVMYGGNWSKTGPSISTDNKKYIREGSVGAMLNVYSAKGTRELQKVAVEESRLGIPLLFGYDVIHGHRTIFPINLGMSASWDLRLIEQSARIAAEEASSEGLHWTFAPMVDIARDPRWGRISEGAGEDVYLGSEIAKAYLKAFKGMIYQKTIPFWPVQSIMWPMVQPRQDVIIIPST